MLAIAQGIAPFPKDLVVDLGAQEFERFQHIGINELHPHHKILKHLMHRRVQIVEVFLHSGEDVFTSEVGGCHGGERCFQLCGNVFPEVAGSQLHIPERQQHKAHRHHRSQKEIAQHDGDGGTDAKQQQRAGAKQREVPAAPGHGQDILRHADFPF